VAGTSSVQPGLMREGSSNNRPSAIVRRLWKARAWEPLAIGANLGYRFYAHNLHRFYNCDWHVSPVGTPIGLPVMAPIETKRKAVCG
jgi:hypothetical protein